MYTHYQGDNGLHTLKKETASIQTKRSPHIKKKKKKKKKKPHKQIIKAPAKKQPTKTTVDNYYPKTQRKKAKNPKETIKSKKKKIVNPHKLPRDAPAYKQPSKTTVDNCFP